MANPKGEQVPDAADAVMRAFMPGDDESEWYRRGWEAAVQEQHGHPDGYTADCEDCPPDLDKTLDLDRVALALEWTWPGVPFHTSVVALFIRRLRQGLNIAEVTDADEERAAGGTGEVDPDADIHVPGDGGRADADGGGHPSPEGRTVGVDQLESRRTSK